MDHCSSTHPQKAFTCSLCVCIQLYASKYTFSAQSKALEKNCIPSCRKRALHCKVGLFLHIHRCIHEGGHFSQPQVWVSLDLELALLFWIGYVEMALIYWNGVAARSCRSRSFNTACFNTGHSIWKSPDGSCWEKPHIVWKMGNSSFRLK